MASNIIPQEKLKAYDGLIASHPEIERKGKNNPYTSINGHMFSFLSKEGVLGLRMSKEDKEAFEKKYNTKPFIQYGAVMRGYVTVPDEILMDIKKAKKYLEMSYNYAKSLKPK